LMDVSGEFVLQDFEFTLLSKEKLWNLIRKELNYYDLHRPLVVKNSITLSTHSPYIFPPIPGKIPQDGYCTPEWISSVTPANNPYVGNILFNNYGTLGPRHVIWRYQKPNFYYQGYASDTLEIVACYRRSYDIIKADGEIVDVNIQNLSLFNDNYFFDLLKGRFMESIGRSRRAFTLADFPISMDAGELVSEGVEIVKEAKETIETLNSWGLSVGR